MKSARPIKLHLPAEVVLRINKYMASPSSFINVQVSTKDWDDYDKCLHLHKKYKLLCYIKKKEPIMFMEDWNSEVYELFLHVYPHM